MSDPLNKIRAEILKITANLEAAHRNGLQPSLVLRSRRDDLRKTLRKVLHG